MTKMPSTSRLSATLKRGTIHVDLAATPLNPADFFDFAERRNPKRAFLFVSKVLGRHIPVQPAQMEHCYQALAAKIPTNLPGPVLMIGMAETAVGLGAGVHRAYSQQRNGHLDSHLKKSDVVYMVSTRHPVGHLVDGVSENTPLFARFEEEHSHASSHLIHLPTQPAIRELMLNARSLVLVDDEASTGNTFINLFRALTQAGLNQLEQLVTCTLTDWSAGAVSRAITQLPVQEVSLLQGSYTFEEDLQAPLPEMPDVATTATGTWPLNPAQDWGRLGVTQVADSLGAHIQVQAGERVLVLGTGEFVWRPFLLAERLEKAGAKVHFSSTSRSPIALGHAIKSAFYFTDNYGLGIPNYLYNVDPSQYDRILLCAETPAAAIPEELINQLGAEVIIDGY